MLLPFVVFLLGAGAVLGVFALITYLPGMMARRAVESRLRDVAAPFDEAVEPATLVKQIASAIQLVVQQSRLSDGSRRVTSISEITGMEGDIISMQEIFVFEKTGLNGDGKVMGRFRGTGVRPKCWERLRAAGVNLPANMFDGVTEIK